MKIGKTILSVLLSPLLAGLCSCGYFEAKENIGKLNRIRIGMSRAEVIQIMGEPPEGIFQKDDLLFYYTHPKWYDGQVTSDECTPFVFDPAEDRLLGFGYEYYNSHVILADHGEENGPAAKEKDKLRDTVIRRAEELNRHP